MGHKTRLHPEDTFQSVETKIKNAIQRRVDKKFKDVTYREYVMMLFEVEIVVEIVVNV